MNNVRIVKAEKFEDNIFKPLIGSILQAMLAVCRGIKMICREF